MTGIPFKKRVTIVSIAVMMAIGVGAGAGASLAVGFKKVDESKIMFSLMAADTQNSPQSIEDVYCLSEIPEGYYLKELDDSLLSSVTYFYETEDNDDFIYFTQIVKRVNMGFDNDHILSSEDVMVGDKYGLFMTWERTTTLLWDNGDYVLEIFSRLPKEETINLAESAKICEDISYFEKKAS